MPVEQASKPSGAEQHIKAPESVVVTSQSTVDHRPSQAEAREAISRVVRSHAFAVVEADVPSDQTLTEYRQARQLNQSPGIFAKAKAALRHLIPIL